MWPADATAGSHKSNMLQEQEPFLNFFLQFALVVV